MEFKQANREYPMGLNILAAGSVFLLVFATNTVYVLNHFLDRGAFLLDSGLFAGMVYRNPMLMIPPSVGTGSHLAIHFTPILQAFSLASYLVPLPPVYFYALTQGVIYGTLALGGYRALKQLFPHPVVAGILTLLFAFNGPAQASISFPHFEPIYAGFALLFMIALFQDRTFQAPLFFALTLSVREDTGFHLFGFIFLILLATWMEKDLVKYRKSLAVYSAVAFLYPLAVMAVQKSFFPGDDALARIYLGNPAFAHLTFDFFLQRGTTIITKMGYIWIPWVALLAASLWRRSWSLLIGFVAVLPWIGLNSIALSDTAGQLLAYYSYPVILSLLWPSVWFCLKRYPPQHRNSLMVVQVAILGLSFGLVFFHHSTLVLKQCFQAPPASMADYHRLEDSVQDLMLTRDNVYFDASIAALFPHLITKDRRILNDVDNSHVKTVVGFTYGIESKLARQIYQDNELEYFYPFKGMMVSLISSEPQTLNSQWGDPSVSEPGSLLTLWMFQASSTAELDRREMVLRDLRLSPRFRFLGFSDWMNLKPGDYNLELVYECEGGSEDDRLVVEIVSRLPSGSQNTDTHKFDCKDPTTATVPFSVPDGEERIWEVRLFKDGPSGVAVRRVALLRR